VIARPRPPSHLTRPALRGLVTLSTPVHVHPYLRAGYQQAHARAFRETRPQYRHYFFICNNLQPAA